MTGSMYTHQDPETEAGKWNSAIIDLIISTCGFFFTKRLICQKTKHPRTERLNKRNNPHPVQIGVRIFWHVVVEHNIDSLNVHPSAEEVGCHQDPPLEVLELLIARQSMG